MEEPSFQPFDVRHRLFKWTSLTSLEGAWCIPGRSWGNGILGMPAALSMPVLKAAFSRLHVM